MSSPAKQIRTAVIGTGYLGRFHAQKYASMSGVDLVAVVDTDLERARQVAEEVDCEALIDARELPGRVDAVSVVVPNTAHYEVTVPLLEAGLHVLLEKPLTSTVEQADHLIELARSRGVILQAGHLERFNPAVEVLLERVTAPLFIEAHRLSGFKNRATDVDVVLDLMIHDIDLVLSMVRSPVLEIRASGFPVLTPNLDIANARLTFTGGCTANLTASRVSLKDMRKVRVFQQGAYISADCAGRTNQIVTGKIGPDGKPQVLPEAVDHGPADHLMLELEAFIGSVRGERPVAVTATEGRNALDVAIKINDAIRTRMV